MQKIWGEFLRRDFLKVGLIYWPLVVHFLGLGIWKREYAYLHLSWHGIPLYVGELALGFSLLSFFLSHSWGRVPNFFRVLFLLFLGLSLSRFLLEFFMTRVITMDSLRNLAFIYMSLWSLFAFIDEMKPQRLLAFFGFLAAICVAIDFANIKPLILGNEILAPYFLIGLNPVPLLPRAFLLGTALGSQFFVLVKKNWILSILIVLGFDLILRQKIFRRDYWWKFTSMIALGSLCYSVLFLSGFIFLFHYREFNRGHEITTKTPSESSTMTKNNHRSFLSRLIQADDVDDDDLIQNMVDSHVNDGMTEKVFHKENFWDPNAPTWYPSFRMHLWKESFSFFLKNPLLGVGFQKRIVLTLPGGEPARSEGKWISGPHNSFITILARGGFFLGIPFLLLVGSPLFLAFQKFKKLKEPLCRSFFILYICTMIYAFFNVCLENPQNATFFWLTLGATIRSFYEDNTKAGSRRLKSPICFVVLLRPSCTVHEYGLVGASGVRLAFGVF